MLACAQPAALWHWQLSDMGGAAWAQHVSTCFSTAPAGRLLSIHIYLLPHPSLTLLAHAYCSLPAGACSRMHPSSPLPGPLGCWTTRRCRRPVSCTCLEGARLHLLLLASLALRSHWLASAADSPKPPVSNFGNAAPLPCSLSSLSAVARTEDAGALMVVSAGNQGLNMKRAKLYPQAS